MREKNQKKRKFYIKKLLFGYFGVSFIFGSIVIFFMDIQNTTLLDFFMTVIIFSIGTLFMYFALKSRETVVDDVYRPQQESSYAVDEFADTPDYSKKRKWSVRKLSLYFLGGVFTFFGAVSFFMIIDTGERILSYFVIAGAMFLLGIFFLFLAVKPGKHKSSETVVDDVYRPQQEVRYAVDEFADTVEKQNYETANSTESNEQKQPNTSGNEIELWTTAQAVTFVIGIIVFVINFVLCCKKGFSFLFLNGVILFSVSILFIAIPYVIYAIKRERAIPPEIKAAIKARRLRYHGENVEEEMYRHKRERAERFWNVFSCLALAHILFGRKK